MLLFLQAADPSILWPERGSAEKQLCEREGWEHRTIPVVQNGVSTMMDAMCRAELAVNQMLDGDEGFAICLAKTGWRISFGGAVYARCADAMVVAEKMMAQCASWSACQTEPYTEQQRAILKALTKDAERNGQVLLDRVYPI